MYTKVIKSGDIVEIYTYAKDPFPTSLRKKTKKRRSQGYRALRNSKRATKAFRALVRSNITRSNVPSFLTLTMRTVVDLGVAWKASTRFFDVLKRKNPSLLFIVVPEFQKRGAVHLHALVWGINHLACIRSEQTYRDTIGKSKRKHVCESSRQCERNTGYIADIWKHGFVSFFQTDGSPKLASYLAKYMQKEMSDPRGFQRKAYSASRKLVRQVHIKSSQYLYILERELKGDIMNSDGTFQVSVDKPLDPVFERDYNTKWLGPCNYKVYNLSGRHEQ